MSSLGHPNLVIIFSYINLATVFASSVLEAKASAHFVTYSVATKIYCFLPYRLGGLIGPTKSMPHFSNGIWAKIGF